jgi:hypothetical protein
MGNPIHYSVELPQRCLQLIDELWPVVARTRERARPDLGALTTTFLISLSMPIISLPIERLEKHRKQAGYADDRHIQPGVASAVRTVLGNQQFKSAPFYFPNAWHFITWKPNFNIADPIPADVASALDSREAAITAGTMPTLRWCKILRNAMAHGGIAYLDAAGISTYDRPVEQYAFVSGGFDRKRRLVRLDILRITESNYRKFLHMWVEWLKSSGLDELAA